MSTPALLKAAVKRMLLPRGLCPRRVLGGALRGRRLLLDLHVDTQVWRGIYEVSLQNWLREHVKVGDRCVDVGAAEGSFTLLMAMLAGESGRVLAFEPSSRGDQIRRNFELNADVALAPLELVRAYAAAEGSEPTASDGTRQESVDAALTAHGFDKVDVVKIDVDGGELEVLAGMRDTLLRHRPHLAIEVHALDLRDGVLNLLEPLGYGFMEIAPPKHEHRPIPFNPTLFSVKRPNHATG